MINALSKDCDHLYQPKDEIHPSSLEMSAAGLFSSQEIKQVFLEVSAPYPEIGVQNKA